MREFAREKGCRLYDIGAGICHQVMVENEHARPGEIVIGADSHSCAYGAVAAFATGMGSTDAQFGEFLGRRAALVIPTPLGVVLGQHLTEPAHFAGRRQEPLHHRHRQLFHHFL